ncbi:hypothetical protein LEM8419_02470 [Neolewinella maritima]|uniref:Nucleotide-diphospho-sugar transferase domain-containing protein n=1 Tax=Neolewinella maritima TaxID=1383882 RepID=A0ABN8F698_9BACT|nr:hypothetical protein [Neolewinella maritima]CAH1001567.1 hypothetical protein LEM8419_02470 [Neolewinella maritima]
MIVLYLTFGQDVRVHQQAVFSAMTVLQGAGPRVQCVVYTDAPDYYRLLGDRVQLRVTTPGQLQEWRGPHDFFWRIKIKALEALQQQYPGESLVYLDADTFCFGELSTLEEVLATGTHLMHAREGELGELPTSTERRMYRQCSGNNFAGIPIDGKSTMYNAGVVGLAADRAAEAIQLALDLCDAMCAAGVTRRLVEQFALSVALAERGGLAAANGSIGHYWGNKAGWNERIAGFFLAQHLQAAGVEDQIAASQDIDFTALPIYMRSSGTRNKLNRWVDRAFDKGVHAYVPRPGDPPNDRSERLQARRV